MLNVCILEHVAESENSDLALNCCNLLKSDKIECQLICLDEVPDDTPSVKCTNLIESITSTLNKHSLSLTKINRIPANKKPDLNVLELLKENEVDLLLMNKSPFSKHSTHFGLIKSPMQKLLDRIPCSTILLNKNVLQSPPLKVLFSYTGSIYSGSAGAVLTRILKPENVEIHIVSVESIDYSTVSAGIESSVSLGTEPMLNYTDYNELGRGIALEMEHLITQVKYFLEQSGYTVSATQYLQGEPVETITRYADEIQADLIVMGVHRGIMHHQKIAGPVGMEILKKTESSIAILH